MDIEEQFILDTLEVTVAPEEGGGGAPVVETPVAEAPVVDTPPVEAAPAAVEAPAAEESEQVSPGDYINTISNGRFADEESISEFFNKSDEREAARTKLQTDYDALKTNSEKSPFANDAIKELNTIVAGGGNIEKYIRLSSINVDDLSNQEALSLQLQHDKGISKTDADYLVGRKYKLSETEALKDPDHENHDAVRQASIEMQVEGQDAKESLKTNKLDLMKVATPEPAIDQEAVTAKREIEMDQYIEAFQPRVSRITESMQTVDFPVNDKFSFEYSLPDGFATGLTEHINGIIRHSEVEVPNNEAGQEVLQKLAKNYIVNNNFDDIVKGVAEQARTLTDEDWMVEVNNPSAVNVSKSPESTPELSQQDDWMQQISDLEDPYKKRGS